MEFKAFNFDEKLLDGLDAMGFRQSTPIQQQAIPLILQNKDLIACAQTGTGKTAAYVLPILDKIIRTKHRHLNTLIIAPTRELAQQIDQQIEGLGYFIGVSSIAVYGGGDGAAWDQQQKSMREGADIIIATPGRLLSMLNNSSSLKMEHLEHLVLDEADRMLDMGFYEDIMRIIHFLPKKRQTILFSATMPAKMRTLARNIMNNPEEVNIAISKPPEGILQQAYMVHEQQKNGLLKLILKEKEHKSVIIFASTKEKVKDLYRHLQREKMPIKSFHSDLEQDEREDIMRAFKNKDIQILIGTDILSRGIDVDGISLVINYDVPPDPEDYVHRIGRTARAETKGTAITFIDPKTQRRFKDIEDLIGKEVDKLPVPEQFGEAPVYNPQERKKRKNFRKKPGNKTPKSNP